MVARQAAVPGEFIKRQKIGRGVVKSAARALQILEFFDDTQQPANVVKISEVLNYPQSSTSALLRSLVNTGYLIYDTHARSYITSTRVALLGNWVSPKLTVEGSVLRMMRELNQETGETVFLGMRNGMHIQYIHVVQASDPSRYHLTLGTIRALAGSAAGLAILSLMPDREIVRILNRINAEAESDGDIAKSKDVLEVLSAIRRQGYSFSASKPWGAAIAAPLPSMPGEPSLAVGIGGITKIMAGNKERYAELLLNSIRKYFGNLAGSLG